MYGWAVLPFASWENAMVVVVGGNSVRALLTTSPMYVSSDVYVCICVCVPTVLKIFLILIPPILAAMARFEGKTSVSEVDFAVGEQVCDSGGQARRFAAVLLQALAGWFVPTCGVADTIPM
jgi:hypothetical protein